MFKYSICSYSTTGETAKRIQKAMFKYSICSYSTIESINPESAHISLNTASVLIQLKRHSAEITVYVFKYSICSYSTCAGMMQCDPPVMFKYSICSYSTQSRKSKYSLPRCLNTASVLIQQVPIVAVCYVDVFKYSICSYSTPDNR